VANDPTFETRLHAGTLTLVKADLGTKRICPSCSARFYDLQKRPIECPKCAFTFEPEALYKQRRPRQPEPQPAAAVVARDEEEEVEEEEEETTEDSEAEEEAEEVVEEPVVVASDDDDDAEEEAEETAEEDSGMSVVEPDAEVADIEDIEDEEVEDEGDDGLLEEVEEDEDDVSGIIDTDIGKDEP